MVDLSNLGVLIERETLGSPNSFLIWGRFVLYGRLQFICYTEYEYTHL